MIVLTIHGDMSVLIDRPTTAEEVCRNIGSRLALMGHEGRGHLYEVTSVEKRTTARTLPDDEVVKPMTTYAFLADAPSDG
jgi:hypothetical protein